jgi:hypothetical protein
VEGVKFGGQTLGRIAFGAEMIGDVLEIVREELAQATLSAAWPPALDFSTRRRFMVLKRIAHRSVAAPSSARGTPLFQPKLVVCWIRRADW